jgi:hypothetical protein
MPSDQERRDLRGFSEAERLAEDEEFQALRQARRRAAQARLRLGLVCLCALALLLAGYGWYQTAPVPAGFYPGKVLGGLYFDAATGEFRYPLMLVKSSPFQSGPPELGSVSLLDETGEIVATSDHPRFEPAKGQPAWSRHIFGWITLRVCPGCEGRIAYTATVETASGSRSYDVGALAVLGAPTGETQTTTVDFSLSIAPADSGLVPSGGGLWMMLSLTNRQDGPLDVQRIAPAGLGWLFTPGPTVLRGPGMELYVVYSGEGLPPGLSRQPASGLPIDLTSGTRVTIVRQVPSASAPQDIALGWADVDGPVTVEAYKQACFAVVLAPYAEQLRRDYFLYLSAEVGLAQEEHAWLRGVTILDEQPRSWRAFQTVPARSD